MSAHDTESNRRRAGEQGAVAFLRKPMFEEKILEAIRRAIGAEDQPDKNGTYETKVP